MLRHNGRACVPLASSYSTGRIHRLLRWIRAGILAALAVAALGLLYLRTFRLPEPTGPYVIGTTLRYVTDPNRSDPYLHNCTVRRSLVLQLWYTAAPSKRPLAAYMRWREAPLDFFYAPLLRTHARWNAPIATPGSQPAAFPVLLFSPRWNGRRTQNTVLAEELASQGYVVAAIDHPHNGSRVELADGSVVRGTEALEGPKGAQATAQAQLDSWTNHLQLWADDQRFVLNQLTAWNAGGDGLFSHHLDLAHVGAFGHSFGGAASVALCGLDPRMKAAINLDGWTLSGTTQRTAPILLLYEGATRAREQQLASLPRPGSIDDQIDRADFDLTESNLRSFGGYRAFVAGTQHMDFSDEPLLPP